MLLKNNDCTRIPKKEIDKMIDELKNDLAIY